MSRIGRKPIAVPAGVKIQIAPDSVEVQGPKGKLNVNLPRGITLEQKGAELVHHRPDRLGAFGVGQGVVPAPERSQGDRVVDPTHMPEVDDDEDDDEHDHVESDDASDTGKAEGETGA